MKRTVTMILALCLCFCLLPGVVYADTNESNTVTVDREVLLSSLYEADISSIRETLSLGLITSQELTAYYLDRISQYNKPYNCFITVCEDAMEVARERDIAMSNGNAQGLLFGIPVVVKDNMDMSGYHTTNGYKKKDEQIAQKNADVVQALLDEGAVIIAKTNMSTGAQDALRSHSQAVGETKNAYSPYMASGGSSGGTAVSVSLNFAVAGLGTDTNSSLRIPAALSGCVSLRPTFGLLSKEGIVKLNGSRDTAGAITRSVYDQAIMLDVLTGGEFSYTKNLNGNVLQGMRIGVLKQLSYATSSNGLRSDGNIDDEVAAAFENAIAQLRSCGADVVTVSMPKLFSLSDATFKSGEQELKDALYAEFQRVLEENDISAVIYPSYLSAPIRSGTDANGIKWDPYSQTNINNCRTLSPSAGIPEICVPIGVHSLGAGIGMEIAAQRNQEQLLLDIAYTYTQKRDQRTVPTGAPDAFADHHKGSLTDVIADYRTQLEQAQHPSETTQPTLQETVNAETQPSNAQKADDFQINIKKLIAYWPFAVLLVLLISFGLILRAIKKRKARERKQRAFAAFNKSPDS